jgi:hypothetical protein
MSIRPFAARGWLIAALAAVAGPACAIDPTGDEAPAESVTAQAGTPVQDLNAAETSFRDAVKSSVNASAAAAGFALGLNLQVAYVPRERTLASCPTTRDTQAMHLSRPVKRASGSSFDPGLYELSSGSSGPILYIYDAAGNRLSVPPPAPAPFHTPLGHDLCRYAPGSLHDYCEDLVACWAYDLWC